MRLKNLDLVGVIFIVIINVGWMQIPHRPWFIGIFLAFPLTFVLPGYAITQSLFSRKSPEQVNTLILKPSLSIGRPIGFVDYITLSLGLSMAVDVLVGFALNIFPIGLQAQSWVISIGLLTTVFTLIAFYIRRRDDVKSGRISKPPIAGYQYMLFGSAILVVIAAVGISLIRPPATAVYFTQFWMLPSHQATTSCAVNIGVQNFEASSKTYRVTIAVNNASLSIWQSVNLAPKETWERLVPIHTALSNTVYIEAKLYELDKPETVYREVHMTLSGSAGSGNAKTQC
jgi:uncharacterized membrane protein